MTLLHNMPEIIKDFSGVTVATSESWDYKVTIYKDGSASLDYIAKDKEHLSGIWCGISSLKRHLKHNAYLQNKSDIIPNDWTILQPVFFEALDIL